MAEHQYRSRERQGLILSSPFLHQGRIWRATGTYFALLHEGRNEFCFGNESEGISPHLNSPFALGAAEGEDKLNALPGDVGNGGNKPNFGSILFPSALSKAKSGRLGSKPYFCGQAQGKIPFWPHSPQKDGVLHGSTPMPWLWHSVT